MNKYFLVIFVASCFHISAAISAPSRTGPNPGASEQVPLYIRSTEDPEEEEKARQREKLSSQHDAADLVAQERTADAAERQVTVAWTALLVSAVGAIGLIYSLILTRRSLDESSKASKLAVAAANSYVTSERAWLAMVGATSHDFKRGTIDEVIGDGTAFQITIKNAGKTPALNVEIYVDFKLVGHGEDVPVFAPNKYLAQRRTTTIIPDMTVSTSYKALFSADIENLKSFKTQMYLFYSCKYNNVFRPDEHHITSGCLQVVYFGQNKDSRDELNNSFNFIPVGNQNSAT